MGNLLVALRISVMMMMMMPTTTTVAVAATMMTTTSSMMMVMMMMMMRMMLTGLTVYIIIRYIVYSLSTLTLTVLCAFFIPSTLLILRHVECSVDLTAYFSSLNSCSRVL